MTITENQVAASQQHGFTSGTQALQGRNVNRDPFFIRRATDSMPRLWALVCTTTGSEWTPVENPEFAVPDSPILVAFREYATINKGKATVARFADEYLRFRLWGKAISDQTVISHAIRVLTKLAAGMHLDGPVRGSHLSRGESSDHE